MPFKPSDRRFDMYRHEETMYYKDLPTILTCLALDYGELIPNSEGKKIRSLKIGAIYTQDRYSIKRVQ